MNIGENIKIKNMNLKITIQLELKDVELSEDIRTIKFAKDKMKALTEEFEDLEVLVNILQEHDYKVKVKPFMKKKND
jgi:uncharacterized membrane protein YgaE (UPF0421/DUF939 family)